VQFEGLRPRRPVRPDQVVGWGNLAQDLQNRSGGQRLMLEGRLRISNRSPAPMASRRNGPSSPSPKSSLPWPKALPRPANTRPAPLPPAGGNPAQVAQARPARAAVAGSNDRRCCRFQRPRRLKVPTWNTSPLCLKAQRRRRTIRSEARPSASVQPFAGQIDSIGPLPASRPPGRGARSARPHSIWPQQPHRSALSCSIKAVLLSFQQFLEPRFWTSAATGSTRSGSAADRPGGFRREFGRQSSQSWTQHVSMLRTPLRRMVRHAKQSTSPGSPAHTSLAPFFTGSARSPTRRDSPNISLAGVVPMAFHCCWAVWP